MDWIGKKVYSRNGKERGFVIGTSYCQLSECGGIRLHVKWKDGEITKPCIKGCKYSEDGSLQIR